MTSDQFNKEYHLGITAFERGQYRQAVYYLEGAIALVAPNSYQGGEAQMWLVTAYDAAGDRDLGITLCQKLVHHPHPEIQQQAKQVLYILKAPQLKRPSEWLVQIPDLSQIDNTSSNSSIFSAVPTTPKPKSSSKPKDPQPIDLSLVNTRPNGFIWFGLGAIGVLIVVTLWFY